MLTAVAGGYSLKQHRTLLLHRTQTEEWKGWMQVGWLPGAGSWGGGWWVVAGGKAWVGASS